LKVYHFEAASDDVIEKLNTPFRSVFPLHLGSPALQADFFLRTNFQIKFLEELKVVRDQLIGINLSKMPVADKDLEILATFPNIEVVNLNFTDIDGSGLVNLRSLKNLESVSLAGTATTAAQLAPLLDLPNLKSVYLWNTNIAEREIEELRKKYPSVSFVGKLFSEESILKLGKPRLENETLLRKGELITLKHSMPGVRVLVTKDSSDPDSTSGLQYEKPFPLNETTVVKAKACKEGWYCSEMLELTCFVEGASPRNVNLFTVPDKQYPGKGASTLTDLQKGFVDILKEPSWLGYRDVPFSAGFEFQSGTPLNKIVLSYGRNIGGFVFPPQEVEVWAGDDFEQLSLIKKMSPVQPKDYAPNGVYALSIPLDSQGSYKFYRVTAKPVSHLPKWHKSKGEHAWFFIDEIFFY
jgi:hypothetical protein